MQNTTKIIQAFIQAAKEVAGIVNQADTKAQAYKAKYVALNPDLTGTNISQIQLNALNTWIAELHTLATSSVVSVIESKDQPSHGTIALG